MVMLLALILAADALPPSPLPTDNPAAESRLRRALYYFNQGEYAAIAPMIEPLLDPPRFATEDELVLARKMLGQNGDYELVTGNYPSRRGPLTVRAAPHVNRWHGEAP